MAFVDPRDSGFVDPRKQGFIDPRKQEEVPVNPEDTQPLTTVGILGQEAKSAIGFIAAPFDILGNIGYVTGLTDVKDPVSTGIQWLQEKVTGDTRESFVPSTDKFTPGVNPRAVAETIGEGFALGTGFIPVQRAGGATSSVMADLFGFGSSEAAAFEKMAQTTAKALAGSDAFTLGSGKLNTPEDIYDELVTLASAKVQERNRPLLTEYTKELRKMVKNPSIHKDERKFIRSLIDSGNVPQAHKLLSEKGLIKKPLPELRVTPKEGGRIMKEATDELIATYGKTEGEVRDAIVTSNKLPLDDAVKKSFERVDEFVKTTGSGKDLSTWDYVTLPIADVMRKYVDRAVGGRFERAAETATRMESIIPAQLIEPASDVIELISKDRDLKRALMDLHLDQSNLFTARNIVRNKLGADGVKQFDEFIKKSEAANKRIQSKLFVEDPKIKKEDIYLHAERRAENPNKSLPRFGKSDTVKPTSLKDRKRGSAYKMTDEEVDQYVNPFLAQAKHITDMEHLVQVGDAFRIRPAMKTESSVNVFFSEVEKEFMRRGMDAKKANMAHELMNFHYMGMTHAPGAAVRGTMSLGYAGTLAQLKSAFLNLADITVSMTNQGVKPTMKALFQRSKGLLGKNLTELGLDNSQNVGEFVRSYDKYMKDITTAEKFARGAHKLSDGAMLISGFKLLDRTGKGVILRAAVNQAMDAAKNGKLVATFGDVMSEAELKAIRPYLMKGTKPKDMPPQIAAKVEELAFTALGRQQLISAAGRPMAYLRNPIVRPAYAMTGFAIKQLAMLRRGVVGELRAGNAKGAAAYAAKYTALVGVGTALLNEGRATLFQDKEFHPEDVLIGTLEQLAAVITMNKIADPYSLQKATGDPVRFVMESMIPPLGLAEAAAADVFDLVFRGKYNAELVKKAPLLGDFYKYYWSKDKPKDRGSNVEQYKEFFENWGED